MLRPPSTAVSARNSTTTSGCTGWNSSSPRVPQAALKWRPCQGWPGPAGSDSRGVRRRPGRHCVRGGVRVAAAYRRRGARRAASVPGRTRRPGARHFRGRTAPYPSPTTPLGGPGRVRRAVHRRGRLPSTASRGRCCTPAACLPAERHGCRAARPTSRSGRARAPVHRGVQVVEGISDGLRGPWPTDGLVCVGRGLALSSNVVLVATKRWACSCGDGAEGSGCVGLGQRADCGVESAMRETDGRLSLSVLGRATLTWRTAIPTGRGPRVIRCPVVVRRGGPGR